jgi:hypothetical protein
VYLHSQQVQSNEEHSAHVFVLFIISDKTQTHTCCSFSLFPFRCDEWRSESETKIDALRGAYASKRPSSAQRIIYKTNSMAIYIFNLVCGGSQRAQGFINHTQYALGEEVNF